jgi:hypothetical protein
MRLVLTALTLALAVSPASAQQGAGSERLRAMDANGDGAITRAEAQAVRETMFARLDADRDNYLNATERAAGRGGARQGLEGADADDDGRVSRAELLAQPYRAFDRFDRNSDNVLSAEELAAVAALWRGGG